jgi:hypothetical protein
MTRKIDPKFDQEVLEYLKNHSYSETEDHFIRNGKNLSSRTIKLIKDRSSKNVKEENGGKLNPEIKNAIQIMLGLFKEAIKIPEFQQRLSEEILHADEILEKVI